MRRFLLPGVITVVAVALLALLLFGIANQGTNTSIDSQIAKGVRPRAPDAGALLPVLGSTARKSLADFRGKVVVMNVFASWCDPCVAEAPILERIERQIAGRGATVLGITYLDNSSDSEHFVREHHLTYPVLRDITDNFARAWGVNGVPETFVIDRRGRVAALRRYQLAGNWLQTTVSKVLADPS